ncbi:geranylgeranyl transferase type-2 subunit alpha [Venturia canescens]|uniref:geranylgeranyl transferase type-2 subunit alpha n=1 Tax=Venturia canescens TaxID=32260 RepID=UPI001C9BD05B|nr:geranylgeranyl transferase type-2 subunit alpha [Venturia canescens]
MHGRVKVRTTAEQEALKKIERAKKTAQYKMAMKIIFQKRADKLWDDELLEVTERVVLQNPDINTLWNIRRDAFNKNDWTQEERTERMKRELTLTENCLRENPKSYGVWHHRCWIIDHMPEPDWKMELALCAKCLNLDERNFHCWDYRQYLVKKAGISDTEEFDFSTTKILNNFSNYSSWHYRSKILSKMFPDETGNLPIKADKHKEELDFVMNATFTDPNDSSAWFYQRWLLDCSRTKSNSVWRARVTSTKSTIVFCNDVKIEREKIALLNNGKAVESMLWESPNNREYSKTWTGTLVDQSIDLMAAESIAIEFENNVYDFRRSLNKDYWFYNTKYLTNEIHDKSQLKEQMENYKQLSEMEPNNKWSLLTGIYLMKNYDLKEYNAKILQDLSALTKVDALRSNYYNDMRSKCIMEYKLHNTWQNENEDELTKSIDLSDLGLTVLYDEHHLCFYEDINLDGNDLSNSLHRLVVLQECTKLSLSSNNLCSLKRMPVLPNLKWLSLRHNELSDINEILEFVRRHEKLEKLDLRDNPIALLDAVTAKISSISSILELMID